MPASVSGSGSRSGSESASNPTELVIPSTSSGSSDAVTKETDIEAVLELLGQLRRGYINLETVVTTEPERILARTARRAVDRDIERMCELRQMAAAHRAHMADFARRVQRSQIHVRLIQLMLRQTRQRLDTDTETPIPPAPTTSQTPDAGGDDGGVARQMRQMQISFARLDDQGRDQNLDLNQRQDRGQN